MTLAGIGISLNANSTSSDTFGLVSSAIASNSTLTVANGNTFSSTSRPTLLIQGTSYNSGTIAFTGSVTFVQMSDVTGTGSGTLVNTGTISLTDASPQFQAVSGASTPTLTNNGLIAITNPDNVFQSPVFGATINGTGTITIGSNAKADFATSVGTGQTLTFTGGVNAGSVVQIDAPTSFGATLSNFVSGDRVTLTNAAYTGATYTPTSNSSGVLNIYNGSTNTGSLNLSGVYSLSSFSFNYQQVDSTRSTLAITTTVQNSVSGSTTATTAAGPVYRFFDTKYGTHFFTSDVGEKNTVLATRSDLTQETNGFGDVAQTDPNATAVYRFFDTKFGTHFFTASSSERDTILTTRPDLTYEPTSTFFEHATQQSGDVAVYRFFDTQYGTHFYTGDAGEFAGLTSVGSATYRANLTYEGVGFYAPAGTFT